MTSEALLAWLEAVSKGMAKAKRPPRQSVFLLDKPLPPRYRYRKRRDVSY